MSYGRHKGKNTNDQLYTSARTLCDNTKTRITGTRIPSVEFREGFSKVSNQYFLRGEQKSGDPVHILAIEGTVWLHFRLHATERHRSHF